MSLWTRKAEEEVPGWAGGAQTAGENWTGMVSGAICQNPPPCVLNSRHRVVCRLQLSKVTFNVPSAERLSLSTQGRGMLLPLSRPLTPMHAPHNVHLPLKVSCSLTCLHAGP